MSGYDSPPSFRLDADQVRSLAIQRVPARYLLEFLADGETPGRVLSDYAFCSMLKGLEGPGTIYDLGGAGDYYRAFMRPDQRYVVTNLDPEAEMVVDATNMPFEASSVDAFMSMFALEHIYDFESVINEAHRCLRPGGRFLLAVPFLYYYHAAPDDFFRFTTSALDRMLSGYTILHRLSFGGRCLLISELMHEKRVLGSDRGPIARALMRLFWSPFLLAGLLGDQNQSKFAITQLYLVEKPPANH